MFLYLIHYYDSYAEMSGTLNKMYSNESAAKQAKEWFESHPSPQDVGVSYHIEKIDTDDALDEFVPPMTQEQYDAEIDDYYSDQHESDYCPDDDYYPEPSEEEIQKYEETQRIANELQEAEAKWEEEKKRKNDELIDKALQLCKEILSEK